MNGAGYVVAQVGCAVCGAGCDPLQERCARCKNDPFEGVGARMGPLSGRQFLRNFGWRLLIALPFLGWLFWQESGRLQRLGDLPGWAQVGLGALVAVALLVMGYHLWLTWRAAHVALVLTPAEAYLYQRRGGRVYLERMPWQECLPPEPVRGQQILETLGALAHIVMHAGLQMLAFLIPDQVYEVRLRSRLDADKRWRVALVGAQYHPRFVLTELAMFALPHWLQSGQVVVEQGYEPSAERPFLALDMQTRTLRAYALREVRLPEPSIELSVRPESHNPDGSRVESDHTLEPDAAGAAHAEQRRLREARLPAFAVPYGDYWLRAEWGLIARIERCRAASETALTPDTAPKPL
ncbi:MAG: hypothetical protein KatS3mg018_1291 [Fimbriimonadales bacterium]|nr:MAG: hypothetical protein KatS3mg018_1291 [Fimbriimonadales bacterium]